MNSSINAFEENGIDFAEQRRDVGNNLDLVFVEDVFGELVDACLAVQNIGAAAFECGYDTEAGIFSGAFSSLKTRVKAGTCDVSVPMMPTRIEREASATLSGRMNAAMSAMTRRLTCPTRLTASARSGWPSPAINRWFSFG